MRNAERFIIESIDRSVTTSVTTSVTSDLLPENAWVLLAQFGIYKIRELPRAFKIKELKNIVRGNMHINTIRRNLEVLEEKALIRINRKNNGKTRTAFSWVITTDGLRVWESYLNEIKGNIGKVNI